MNQTAILIPSDTWLPATWEDDLRTLEDPNHEKSKGYYSNHQIEVKTVRYGSGRGFTK